MAGGRGSQTSKDPKMDLISEESHSQCFLALSKFLERVYSPAQSAMWLYTLHGINDASNLAKKKCEELDLEVLE